MRPLRVQGEPAFRTAHANPYNAALYRAVEAEGVEVRELGYLSVALSAPDVVHIHWPELMFLSGHRRWRVVARLLLFSTLLSIARLRGTRLVWTAHNLESHERRFGPFLRDWTESWFTRNVDGFLCLTEDAVAAARQRFPRLADVPAFVTPHGHYRGWYPTPDREESRRSLEIPEDARFVVALGQIRPYKNVSALLGASAALGREDVIVGIAGRPSDPALREELETMSAGRDDVRMRLEFVPDDDIAVWLAAADLVALPYSAIQNSGSALLALSADRPVVVPAVGAMRELQRQAGADWVRLYEGAFDADQLAAALQWSDRARAAQPDLDALDWSRVAAATVEAYRRIPRRRRNSHARNDLASTERYGATTHTGLAVEPLANPPVEKSPVS